MRNSSTLTALLLSTLILQPGCQTRSGLQAGGGSSAAAPKEISRPPATVGLKDAALPAGVEPVLLDMKVMLQADDSGRVQEHVSECTKDRIYMLAAEGKWTPVTADQFAANTESAQRGFAFVGKTPQKLDNLKKLVVRVKKVRKSKDHTIEARLYKLETAGWASVGTPLEGRYSTVNSKGRRLELGTQSLAERVCNVISSSVASLAGMANLPK